jgi:hypothetical protein
VGDGLDVDAAAQHAGAVALDMGQLAGHGDDDVGMGVVAERQLDDAGHAGLRRLAGRQLQQHALERDVDDLAAQVCLGRDQLGAGGKGDAGELAAFGADGALPVG